MARKHPLAECENCPLQEYGAVYGDGPEDAPIRIVGEAPGFNEVAKGKPFVGASGQLLDQVLSAVGIKRSEVRVTNTCLCRPPDNANPPKEAVRCCRPRLLAELEGSEQLVCLGNFAAQAVLGTSEGITRLRQRTNIAHIGGTEIPVIATFHPASCLYQPANFKSMADDLEKISPNQKPRPQWLEPEFRVFDDFLATQALKELWHHDPLVVDIEVGVEKDEDFDHPDRYQMLCIGIAYGANRAVVIGENALQFPEVRIQLNQLFEAKKLIFHNGKFDVQGLLPFLKPEPTWKIPRVWFDTMLASYAVDERSGVHGLKYLAKEILGAPDYEHKFIRVKGEVTNWAEIPKDFLYTYNAYDVVATYQLYEYYRDTMDEHEKRVHDFLCEVSNALMFSELEGVKVNWDYLLKLEDEMTASLAIRREHLSKWVENPNSWQQIKAALKEMGIIVKDTQADTLQKVVDRGKGEDFLVPLLEYKKENKAYGTYVKGTKKRLYKGRVHSTFLLHGTTTGRLASRNPNLQNVPRGQTIKRLFVPEEGNVFVQADYKQAELRCIAAFSGDEYLAEIFKSGRDLHSEVASIFYGPEFTKEQRVRAKAVVFGLSYGREAFSIAREYNMPVKEAEEYLRAFFDVIPQVVKWREDVVADVFAGKDLINPFGRKRRFWLITRENQRDIVKEAYAFLPQSTASDITLMSLVRMREAGMRVRIPVHDSILVECAEREAVRVGREMASIMEETALRAWPALENLGFGVDVNIGKSWGDV